MYSMSNISRHKMASFTPYKGKVFVTDLERGETVTKAGLIITDDNMMNRGIRSRWARVWGVGADIEDVQVGQWLLIEHGRWTQKISLDFDNGESVDVWSIDFPNAVLLVSDEDPRGEAVALHNRGHEFATRKR